MPEIHTCVSSIYGLQMTRIHARNICVSSTYGLQMTGIHARNICVSSTHGLQMKIFRILLEDERSELKREAVAKGGNAVVAIDLDYGDISSTGTMLMLVASGTVVKIKT